MYFVLFVCVCVCVTEERICVGESKEGVVDCVMEREQKVNLREGGEREKQVNMVKREYQRLNEREKLREKGKKIFVCACAYARRSMCDLTS